MEILTARSQNTDSYIQNPMKALAPQFLALAFSFPLSAAVISSAERLDSTGMNQTFMLTHSANNFRSHVPIYYDYSFTYRNVPGYLSGADSLRTRYGHSQDADYQLRLTLDVPATLFLIIDDRIPDIAGTMPWLETMGFKDTGDNADYLYSGTFVRTLSIYSANFPAGDVVLPEQNSPLVGTERGGMYLIGATSSIPEPHMALLLIVGGGIWVWRRGRQQA